MTERVAVLGGTGALGNALARRLAMAGHHVVIGSREAERARSAAEEAATGGGSFEGMTNPDAAAAADRLVVFAVPFANQAPIAREVAVTLRAGQTVFDVTVPLAPPVGGKATELVGVWQGSAAQQLAGLLPADVSVVSGLHTVDAATLADPTAELDQDSLICGAKEGKAVVRELLQTLPGLRLVDAGPLEASRLLESLTPLLIRLNIRHKVHTGIRITGLPPA